MEVQLISRNAICRTGLLLGVNEWFQVPFCILSDLLCQVIDNWAHCQGTEYNFFLAMVATVGTQSFVI